MIPQLPNKQILLLSALLAATSAHAQISANFSDGNGTDQVNQYQGSAGAGWSGGWQTNTSSTLNFSLDATASDTNPIPGSDYSLQINVDQTGSDDNQRNAGVGRRYTDFGGVDTTARHIIQFDMRIDSWDNNGNTASKIIGANGTVDRVSPPNNFVDDSTWLVRVFAGNSGGATSYTWAAYDGARNQGSYQSSNLLNIGTGMTVNLGTVYSFTVDNDPVNGSYKVSVTDGITTVSTPDWLGYRTSKWGDNDPGDPWLNFQAQTRNDGDSSQFTVDNINIAPIPEPHTFAAIAGLAALGIAYLRRQRKHSND